MNDLDATGLFSAADLHFARLMVRLGGCDDPAVLLAAALASRAAGAGDVCLDLRRLADDLLPDARTPLRCPPAEPWVAALRSSAAVGLPGERRPLVLDERHRLYLHRYWDYEQRVAVITGGPGTGKTFTVARLIAVFAELEPGRAPLRVVLAAPTGKAAARLGEALRAAIPGAPAQVATLHRLLQPVAGTPHFRRNAANPLTADLVVVDEASMVDLALMAKFLDALPAETRLVLVGDKDQLASVEAGAVMGDICGRRHAPVFSKAMGARIRELTGQAVPTGDPGGDLAECIVELTTSRRFAAGSAIGELSRAVNRGDGVHALDILSRPGEESVAWVQAGGGAALAPIILTGYRSYADRGSPAERLDRLNRFRVLCAHRAGLLGAEGVNRLAERLLAQQGRIRINPRGTTPWYAGRPVLITRNDYGLGLFNGDAGIALPDPEAGTDELYVFFTDPGDGLRRFLPYRLPAHETVFAMTVHKSQGSEFDQVLLVLPDRDSPVLTREMIYTALTRARRRITLAADPTLLAAAIRRRIDRASGLREALWGVP